MARMNERLAPIKAQAIRYRTKVTGRYEKCVKFDEYQTQFRQLLKSLIESSDEETRKAHRAIVSFFVDLKRSGLSDTDLYYVALRPLWVPDGDTSWHNTVVASELEPQVLAKQQQLVIAQERLTGIVRLSQQVHEQLEALQDHQLSDESRDYKLF
jgi:hypothetical protein